MLDLGALALILGTVALPAPTAWATDYVISDAATTTNGGATLSTGDTLTITATGSVTTSGISGVQTNVGGTIITHNGPITTTGPTSIGILAGTALLGSITGDVTIRGSGSITTGGPTAYGIYSRTTTGNVAITSGDISTLGNHADGISSAIDTGDATIMAGNISTLGNYADGIYSSVGTGDATITAGDISTQGNYADGIYANLSDSGTANLTIVNDHRITVTGALTGGIYLDTLNDHVRIVNTGTISSAQFYGIYATGTDTIITNSGTISGPAGAVKFAGTGNTLSLLAGSKIVGVLAGMGGNTLSIGSRLNTALTYTNTSTVTITTNGIPYVAYGNVLAVVDPTLFAAEDDMVDDLSRSVGNAIDARLGSAIGQSVDTIMASTSNAQATGAQWETWATGLASYREQGEEGLNDGFDTTLGGFALGSDTVLSSGTRFGGFVGASSAHLNTSAGNEQIDSASTYAGIYAGYTLPNAFVNLGLTGGSAKADTSRDVLNNMVAGGIEQAKGNPDGTFITPQATIGTQIKNASGILTPSLRIAYTHLAMDSYGETGSTANMTVAARTVSTLDLRGQVAFAIKPIITATGQFDATMRLGADASFSNSDDISATVLGQPLTFSTTQDTALRGFAGLDLAQAMDNGAKLNLSVEAGYGTSNAVTLQGTAGLVWAF